MPNELTIILARRCRTMPDYKEMYLTLMGATENAIKALILAQRKAEEIYISEPEPDMRLFVLPEKKEPNEE